MKQKTKKFASGTKGKVVFMQGTWEILNYGHVLSFEMCKTFGKYLILGLNTDKLVRSYKHRDPVLPYDQKKGILEAIRYVDKVVPAPHFSPLELLKKYKVDVYVIGSEWIESKSVEIAYIKSIGGQIKIMQDFGKVHTSDIKRSLLEEAKRKQG